MMEMENYINKTVRFSTHFSEPVEVERINLRMRKIKEIRTISHYEIDGKVL